MALLSYKGFMEDVRMRLRNLSTEDLWNLILNWASEKHPFKETLYHIFSPDRTGNKIKRNLDNKSAEFLFILFLLYLYLYMRYSFGELMLAFSLFASPQSHMRSKIGTSDCPFSVNEYSTLGGIW